MFRRIGAALRRFMYGRYGSDQLNMAILVAAVLVSLTNSVLTVFLRESTVYSGIVAPILSVIVYGLLIYSFFRMFSRNVYRRQQENGAYLRQRYKVTSAWRGAVDRWHQRHDYRFFKCPSCRTRLRVPRGKGKINIVCRKCGTSFQRKT